MESGLDWVFEQVEEAIILEDDCLPGPSFFPFCADLLARYRDDQRVAQISGTTHFVPAHLFGGDSYAFGSFAGVWGWATWGRAWHEHRSVFPRQHDLVAVGDASIGLPYRSRRAVFERDRLLTKAGVRYFQEVFESTDPVAFGSDSHWYLSTISLGRYAVTPAVNLVENVGFTEHATHTQSTRKMPAASSFPGPLQHPSEVALNAGVERAEQKPVLVRGNGRLARRVRSVVPQGPLRTVARTLVTGRLTARAVHVVSSAATVLRR